MKKLILTSLTGPICEQSPERILSGGDNLLETNEKREERKAICRVLELLVADIQLPNPASS